MHPKLNNHFKTKVREIIMKKTETSAYWREEAARYQQLAKEARSRGDRTGQVQYEQEASSYNRIARDLEDQGK